MQGSDLTIPGIIFVVLVLIFTMVINVSATTSTIIGLIGFGVTYYLMHRGIL